MSIQTALDKKVWAVLGATANESKFGYKIYMCLKKHGHKVYPVNPNVDSVDGDKCYPSLSDLPEVPEVVDFVVAERFGISAIAECKKLGIPTVWLQPGADKPAVVEAGKAACLEVIENCVLVQYKEEH